MKRKMAIVLTMGLVAGLTGCGSNRQNAVNEVTEQIATQEQTTTEEENASSEQEGTEITETTDVTDATETEKVEDDSASGDLVAIQYEEKQDDRTLEDGTVSLSVYYQRPTITINGNAEATAVIEQVVASDEEDFFINCDSLEQEAALTFADGVTEDMPAYANEVRFAEERVDDKVISLVRNSYSYIGGAHGMSYVSGMNFNSNTGEKLTIDNIAQNKDAFIEEVKTYIQGLCESDEYKDRLMPGYEEYLDTILQDDLWYFDSEGVTFIANQYVLAAYAEGILCFTVPYEELQNLKPEYLKN